MSRRRRTKREGTFARSQAYRLTPHDFETSTSVLGLNPSMIYVTPKAYSDMWHFVDIAEKEVGWLGTVRALPSGDLLIEEVFLLQQTVSFAETEISEEGIAVLASELMSERSDGVDVVNSIRFWGHSHVNMGTNPSKQDDDQMESFRENGCPWFVRGILNKQGRMELDIFLWESGVVINDIPWAIYNKIDWSNRHEIEAEFEAKVTEKSYSISRVGPQFGQGFGDGDLAEHGDFRSMYPNAALLQEVADDLDENNMDIEDLGDIPEELRQEIGKLRKQGGSQ